MWRFIEANVLSGNFLKALTVSGYVFCLPPKLSLTSFPDFFFSIFFKQIPWARNQRKPYSACIASGSHWSSHCSNPPQSGLISDQFWRVWQQKVLTSPMKGLLSPDWAHRAWILFAPLPRQGRSFKQSLYMSPGKGQGEPRRERAPV